MESDLLLKEKGNVILRYAEETGVQKGEQEVWCQLDQCPSPYKVDISMNCQMIRGQVEGVGKIFDVREEEVDMCIRKEGDFSSFKPVDSADSSFVGETGEHTPQATTQAS